MAQERLPYLHHLDYRYLRYIRLIRNKTQKQLADLMGIEKSTVSKLENGQLEFTEHYEKRLREAIFRMRISNAELVNVRELVMNKQNKTKGK